ncbi:MAG TPA: hypothetical protein VM940_00985 [Chthoniobacterales bacterium]|jgi:hypothetical protein|nr:hypothetical protein [Chthoniobacterales bacterium]
MEDDMVGKSGWRRWLVRAVFEAALIVVSIVVALGVNEWRDRRELETQVRHARVSFTREIEANRALLLSEETGLPNHERLLERYREVSAKPMLSAADLQPIYDEFPHGVAILRLRDAVWRSLSGSDLIRRLDQSELFLLAEIYRQQEEIDDFNRAMYAAWRQVDSAAESPGYIKDNVRSTRAYLADMIGAEQRLRKLYERAAETFGESRK